MSAPLISDATLATIVRIISLDNDALPDVSSGDCMRLIRCLTQDRPADALDWARRDGFSAGLLRLLEEANEEAARTHDERELLDPDMPEAEVDAMLREEGVDMTALDDRVRTLVRRCTVDGPTLRAEVARAGKLLAALGRGDVADSLRDASDTYFGAST